VRSKPRAVGIRTIGLIGLGAALTTLITARDQNGVAAESTHLIKGVLTGGRLSVST
jgi:uncharacterized membrane protein YhiD involved in acid resistance